MRTARLKIQVLRRGGMVLSSAACRSGFTMIEMLAVLMILTILVALAVGVGEHIIDDAKRQETMATQRVVMEALKAYYDTVTPKDYPPNETDDSDDCSQVMAALEGNRAAGTLVKSLPSKAYAGGDSSLLDGYLTAMRYRKSKGLGGGPLLVSAGKDGLFGFGADEEPGTADDVADEKVDNIRSDGK